jgi:hypothetical protein
MLAIVAEHPRYGYRMVWAMLRQSGWRVNRKRIYRGEAVSDLNN